MAKKSVKFSLSDGLKPGRAGPAQSLTLHCPLSIKIPARGSMVIDLGLSCDHPLVVFESKAVQGRGLSLEDPAGVRIPGTPIKVTVRNTNDRDALLERSDTLALAHVLDDSGLVVE